VSEILRVTIPAIPVAQPRQRHAVVGGRVRNYTPADNPVQVFKATVRLAVQQAGVRISDGPLGVFVTFYMPRPARLMRRKDPPGLIRHTAKPDVDNLWKSTADALTGLVWHDDAQVSITVIHKWYHEKGGSPRVDLVVMSLPEAGEEGEAKHGCLI
jgi:Holliday junction resolvase RusA-like endonuclease